MPNSQLILTIVSLIFLIAQLVVNYTAANGVFGQDQRSLADKYNVPISPPPVTFAIWGIIYTLQPLWLLYLLYNSIRFSQELQNKITFGYLFYASWIASCIFNASWLIVFSRELITLSTVVLFLLSAFLYISAYTSHRYIGLAAKTNPKQTQSASMFPAHVLKPVTLNLYRALVLNGITFYATWTSVAQCLNVAIQLTYDNHVNSNTASLVALGILTTIFVVYLSLDFFFLRSWLFYTYGPYPVLLWALSWITTNSETGDYALKGTTRTWIYVLIGVTAVALVCKVVLAVLYPPVKIENLKEEEATNYVAIDDNL